MAPGAGRRGRGPARRDPRRRLQRIRVRARLRPRPGRGRPRSRGPRRARGRRPVQRPVPDGREGRLRRDDPGGRVQDRQPERGRILRLRPQLPARRRRDSAPTTPPAAARPAATSAFPRDDPLRVAVVGSGPGRLLHGGRASGERPAGRGRHDRAAADAVGPRPAWRRARPPEHQGRLARVREDRACRRASASSATSRSARTSTTPISRASTTRSSTPSAPRPTGGSAFRARTCRGRGPPPSIRRLVQRPPGLPGPCRSTFRGERAVVIGNGNVAVDVARMLALTGEELAPTDTTDEAIAAIVGSGIREIVMLGRRGPAQAAFTPPELQELGELAGADVVVDPGRPRARPGERRGARGRPRHRAPQRRDPARVRGPGAGRQAEEARAALLRLAGRDPRRGQGRGDRGRAERARRRRERPDPGRADRRRRGRPVQPRPAERRATAACRCPGVPFDERARRRSATSAAACRDRRRSAGSRASTAPAGSSAARAA